MTGEQRNAALGLHLYAERLDRHAERVAADLADARLVESWEAVEAHLGAVMPPEHVDRLRNLGIMLDSDRLLAAKRAVAEHTADLAAVHVAQRHVREVLRGTYGSRPTAEVADDRERWEPTYQTILAVVDTGAPDPHPGDCLHVEGERQGRVVFVAHWDGEDTAFDLAERAAPAHRDDFVRAVADYEQYDESVDGC